MKKINLKKLIGVSNLKRALAFVLVLCMLAAVAGCGDRGNEEQSEQQVSDNFFGDSFTSASGEESASSGSSAVTGNNDVGSSVSGSQSDSGASQGSSKTEVPKENQIGGKSWKSVLKSMPEKLRGTKLVMYNWNPANEYTGAPKVMDEFKKQTGIKVEWRTITYNQYFTKLPAVIASGKNIPDIARTQGPFPTFIQYFEPLSNAKYDFTDEAWDKNILDLYTFNGKQYATSLQNTHIGSVNVLF